MHSRCLGMTFLIRTSPQVAGLHHGAGQLVPAFDDGYAPVHLDLGTHLPQLVDVLEAVVIDALRDHGGAVGKAQQRAHLRLHIRREAGIRQGLEVGAAQMLRALDEDGVLIFLDDRTGLAQLGADAFKVLGDHVFDQHFAAGRSGCHHIGPGLDLVGDDGIGAAVQLLHAVDLDRVGACAADIRSHGVEEVRQVDDMRLSRRIFDDRAAARRHGGEDNVHRRADRDLVKIDARTAQAALRRLGDHKAVAYVHLGAERRHALDVLFDGANAEIAAAGHGRLGLAEAPEHRADQIIGGADLSGEIVRSVDAARRGAVDLDRRAVDESDL